MNPLFLLLIPIIFYLTKKKKVDSSKNIIRDLPPPDPYAGLRVNSIPPQPKIAGAFIDTPSWYKPTDDLSENGIIHAKRLTVRQIQFVFNNLGAHLEINGIWDLLTTQATWDFQYIHQLDNPQSLLNITGEIDVLTQDAIIKEFAKNIIVALENNPDIHIPGSDAWKRYSTARDQNPWA